MVGMIVIGVALKKAVYAPIRPGGLSTFCRLVCADWLRVVNMVGPKLRKDAVIIKY